MRAIRFLILIITILFTSCLEDELLKGNIYTTTRETITQYANNQKELSLFAKLMKRSYLSNNSKTTIASLLNTRGNYTVFFPTNEAVTTYLDSIYGKGKYNIDTIPVEIANRIVLNCTMDFGNEQPILSTGFKEGTVPESMLNDYNLLIQYDDYGNGITTKINRNSYVIKHDIELENGLVHWVNKIIEPTAQAVPTLIKNIDSLSVFYHLLEITSWEDSIIQYKDKDFIYTSTGNTFEYDSWFPKYRMYGYTVFAETNKVFHEKWGVPLPRVSKDNGHVENWNEIMNIINKKCNEIYKNSTSDDPTNTGNALNKFVAYHLVEGKLCYENLVIRSNEGYLNPYTNDYEFKWYAPTDSWRYCCSKGKNRELLKLTHIIKDGTIKINRKSFYNNAFNGDYQETSCPIKGIGVYGDHDRYGSNYARNGYYYTIDDILAYTDEVKYGVLNERIRYDATQYLPELTNGEYYNMYNHGYIPFSWNYFKNLTQDDHKPFNFYNSQYYYERHKIVLDQSYGSFTLKLMPVPYVGKWQVRIDYQINAQVKSCDQVYFGTSPNFYKMNFLDYLDPEIFNYKNKHRAYIYQADALFGNDSNLCMENDKQLRQHYLMKGPKGIPQARAMNGFTINTLNSNGEIVQRSSCNSTFREIFEKCRIILYEGYMEPNKTYYVKIMRKMDLHDIDPDKYKQVIRNLDFIELVPESVYDNPYRAEDIW